MFFENSKNKIENYKVVHLVIYFLPRKFLINPKLKRRKRDGVFRSPKLACNGGKGEINLGYTDRWWKKIELDRVVDSK